MSRRRSQLVENVSLAAYFERVVAASNDAQGSANFVLGELSRLANETGTSVAESFVTPEALAELVAMVECEDDQLEDC